jgi:tetratricopeptide (TPR) repeat protein
MDIALTYLNNNQPSEAVAHCRKAVDLRMQIDHRQGRVLTARAALANTYYLLGTAEAMRGRTAPACRYLQMARAIFEEVLPANGENLQYRTDLAKTLKRLGYALALANLHDQAVTVFHQSLEQRRVILMYAPQLKGHVRELVWTRIYLGDSERKRGRPKAALRAWQEGERILERCAEAEPRNETHQCDISDILMRQGHLYRARKQFEKARACYQRARLIRSRQVDLVPKEPHIRGALGEIYYRLALVHGNLGQRQQELRYYQKAEGILAQVVKDRPDLLVYRQNLCTVRNNLGATLAELGRCSDGAAAVRRAIDQQRRNVVDFAKEAACKPALAGNYRTLAFVFRLDRRPAEAIAASLEARKFSAANPGLLYLIGCDLDKTAPLVGEGKTELAPAERNERRKCCDLAMDVLRQAVAAGYRDRVQFEKNPDLAGLRQRDDFNSLLAGLLR